MYQSNNALFLDMSVATINKIFFNCVTKDLLTKMMHDYNLTVWKNHVLTWQNDWIQCCKLKNKKLSKKNNT